MATQGEGSDWKHWEDNAMNEDGRRSKYFLPTEDIFLVEARYDFRCKIEKKMKTVIAFRQTWKIMLVTLISILLLKATIGVLKSVIMIYSCQQKLTKMPCLHKSMHHFGLKLEILRL